MNIAIRPIESKVLWENFIQECRPSTFLHAWNWGEFHERMNYKIWRLGVSADNNLAGIALLIKIKARRGAFLFCPHGPLLKETLVLGERLPKQKILKALLEIFKKIALSEKCRFIRVSPLMEDSKENKLIFKNLGFRKAPIHIHPELVWILDITPSEDELLRGMRKTTRYSIKKAEKDGVAVIKSSKIDDLEIFWQLYQQTASRHHFTPFSKQYLQKEFENFQKNGQALLLFGRYKDEIISGALIIFYGGLGFYHHGASLPKYTQITASHLLQWEAICEAKKRGCWLYNFWGIAPANASRHPWAGLSLFKKGFGGFSQSYLLTQDFIISPFYWLTFTIEKIRKIKRGF